MALSTQALHSRPPGAPEPAIRAEHLRRVYRSGGRFGRHRKEVVAVDDISFQVPRGTIFGMLGPNGAGKTTTIKMLSTLLVPTSGSASVNGYDVVRDEGMVRRQLGVVLGGERGLYGKLSARDNLVYFGTLYGMSKESTARRVDEMLGLVGLRDRAEERVERYSRGMKQRLHLAKSLLHDPPILFLDEPTIGLDPAAAVDLREAIAALIPAHTVLLTTHDMAEADLLCAEVAIVDRGSIVAQDTPANLKARVTTTRRIIVTTDRFDGRGTGLEEQIGRLPGVLGVDRTATAEGHEWIVLCDEPARVLSRIMAAIEASGTPISAVRVIEPSLEDAFLAIAGRSLG